MYSLNARDHFNCSPLLFSWPASQNRWSQTEGGGRKLSAVFATKNLLKLRGDECDNLNWLASALTLLQNYFRSAVSYMHFRCRAVVCKQTVLIYLLSCSMSSSTSSLHWRQLRNSHWNLSKTWHGRYLHTHASIGSLIHGAIAAKARGGTITVLL